MSYRIITSLLLWVGLWTGGGAQVGPPLATDRSVPRVATPCPPSVTTMAAQLVERGGSAEFDLSALSLREDITYTAPGGWLAMAASERHQTYRVDWEIDDRTVAELSTGGSGLTEIRLRFTDGGGRLNRLELRAPSGKTALLLEGSIRGTPTERDVVISPLVRGDLARAGWYVPAPGAELDWAALGGEAVAGTWSLIGYTVGEATRPLQLASASISFEDRNRDSIVSPDGVASVAAHRYAASPERSSTYRFRLTGQNGCVREYAFPVQVRSDCKFEVRQVASRVPSCPGAADGQVAFVVSGARPGVTYELDGRYSSSGAFTGLAAGDYRLTVRGVDGCITERPVTIDAAEPAFVSAEWIATSCSPALYEASLSPVSSIEVTAVRWVTDAGEAPATTRELGPGTYPFVYSDVNGCDYRDTLVLEVAEEVAAVVETRAPPCAGEGAGTVLIRPSGGLEPYGVTWDDLEAGLLREFVFAGTYTGILYDARGCEASLVAEIPEPNPLLVRHQLLPPVCPGDRDGILTVEASGGSPPYQLRVDSGPWRDSLRADTLTTGAHSFTLRDAAGCVVTQVINVGQRSALPAEFEPRVLAVRQPVFAGDTVRLNVGALPNGRYSSKWTYSTEGYIACDTCTSTVLSPEDAGTVLVSLRDSLGCETRSSVVLRVDPGAPISVPEDFGPGQTDPADRILRVKGRSGTIIDRFAVYDSTTGALVFEAVDFEVGAPSGWDGTFSGVPAPAGDYLYELEARQPTGERSRVVGKTTLVR